MPRYRARVYRSSVSDIGKRLAANFAKPANELIDRETLRENISELLFL